MEREFDKLSQRIAQVSAKDYVSSLKEKIAILNQKLKNTGKLPVDDELTTLHDKYEALRKRNKELEGKITFQSNKIQDLENQCNETGIKLKVLSEEAKVLAPAEGEEKKSPRRTKEEILIKLLRTRYAVALGEYRQTKQKQQQQLLLSKETLEKTTETCKATAEEVAELQEKIRKKDKTRIYSNPTKKARYYKAAAEVKIKENYSAELIQRAWRKYITKKRNYLK